MLATTAEFEHYELMIRQLLEDKIRSECPNAKLTVYHNRKYRGQSQHEHQIDVSAELTLAGVRVLILVECKKYQRAVGNEEVMEFAGRIRDIAAHKGILVTTVGFQEGAKKIAEANGIALIQQRKTGAWDVVMPLLVPLVLPAFLPHRWAPTWRSIRLGTLESSDALAIHLKRANFLVTEPAEQLLKQIIVAKSEITIELVTVALDELGFDREGCDPGNNDRNNVASLPQIYRRAAERFGLISVPAEVGPQLRLQYREQPLGEWLRMAMEPLASPDGAPSVFLVERKHDPPASPCYLDTAFAGSVKYWFSGFRWVFARPLQPKQGSD